MPLRPGKLQHVKMARKLEFFSAGCPLRVSFQNEVEIGKCAPCELEIVDVTAPANHERAEKYGVRVVPTLVIDGKVKVEGRLREPWMCSEGFYEMLERKYPLVRPSQPRALPSGTSAKA